MRNKTKLMSLVLGVTLLTGLSSTAVFAKENGSSKNEKASVKKSQNKVKPTKSTKRKTYNKKDSSKAKLGTKENPGKCGL